jgi:phosphonate degradation associated HDIG domain protein
MPATPEAIAEEVLDLLARRGGGEYFGEAVTKLEHALQCAWRASAAAADEELVLAALLHDIGHLLETEDAIRDPRVGVVNHDALGAAWLASRGFSPRVARLVGGHVEAKRYLTAAEPGYADRLSPASRETLALQGGPMDAASAAAFAAQEHARDLLRLRVWDELAKDPEWRGPGLEAYQRLLVRHLSRES